MYLLLNAVLCVLWAGWFLHNTHLSYIVHSFFLRAKKGLKIAGGESNAEICRKWVTLCVCVHMSLSVDICFVFAQFHKLKWQGRMPSSSLPSLGVKLGQEVREFKPRASCQCMTQLSFKHSCFCWEMLSSPLLLGLFRFRYLSRTLMLRQSS